MYKLYIANRNYSTWSLRGWLVTRLSGAPFEEVLVQLSGKGRNPANHAFSPSGLVPALHDGAIVVWDSLAIADHLAERHPGMWPDDPVARGWARSITAEMHSGFSALRDEMTMCIRERVDVDVGIHLLEGPNRFVERLLLGAAVTVPEPDRARLCSTRKGRKQQRKRQDK